ncbi:hypothetical protein R2103_01945 [Nitrosomonas sp. Is24]|uniref:hypothetical protein n=1 Tax=Nitrosomonas sp. Is24 TaxID=3080533 RepID=UPI00294B2085|nr:hypothetical protein [Nitrosomonas sp. Is24]MDV6340537.1 hypothetical protein [Nitrosomonas sp. Is24]
MQKIKFENRAVAFIDILGFKSVVGAAVQDGKGLCELEELISMLESVVPNLDGTVDQSIHRDLIPKHIYISDCIILSAPLASDKMPSYRGLSILVMRVIQISHILLSKGYLIRGGISVGQVWHTDSNIVGTAYQEAYQIETRTDVPRVELSRGAKELWNRTEGSANTMCLDYEEHFMVNVLHDYYIQDTSHGAIERAFDKYSNVIEKNLAANYPESVEYKWRWFKQYLESETARNKL